jgi:hypothetical protein
LVISRASLLLTHALEVWPVLLSRTLDTFRLLLPILV